MKFIKEIYFIIIFTFLKILHTFLFQLILWYFCWKKWFLKPIIWIIVCHSETNLSFSFVSVLTITEPIVKLYMVITIETS